MVNKNKSLALLLIFLIVASMLPAPVKSAAAAYSGMPNGQDIIKNAAFTDIKGNANAENIMKMSVYSVIREYGGSSYRPNQPASRRDVLAALVNAIGQQDAAVQQGQTLKQQDSSLSTLEAYYRGHIEVAKSSGIITPQEVTALSTLNKTDLAAVDQAVAAEVKKNWKMTQVQKAALTKQKQDQKSYDKAFNTPATREEIAIWIARALKLQPVQGDKTMSVYSFKDWKSIKTEDVPYVEAVLRQNIMSGSTSTAFAPASGITRSTMASILNSVTNQTLGSLGFTVGYGRITDINTVKDVGSLGNTDTTNITIQPPSGDAVNISIQKKSGGSAASQEAVPVIKNGTIGNESLLAKNDIVEYTINKDNQVQLMNVGRLKEMTAVFSSYNPSANTVQVQDKDQKRYTFKVLPDSVIQSEKVPVDIGKVAKNTQVKIIYDGNTLKAMDVDAPLETLNNRDISVKILGAYSLGKELVVMDENNNKQYFQIADNALITINGQKQGIDDIGFDQDAVIKVADGKVLEIKVFTDMPEDEDGRQVVFVAKVRSVGGGKIVLSTDDDPQKNTEYTIGSDTQIMKDKQQIDSTRLRQGDKVKVYTNSDQDKYISRMEVQGEGIQVSNIYKADIKSFSPETGVLILSNVYAYGFNNWVRKTDYGQYKLSDTALVYKGNNRLTAASLKDYIGKTIYAASRKDYGEEQIVQAVLKDGTEDTIYKNISDVKWTSNEMTLSDNRVVNFLNGSIIVKDGRLLDTADLSKDAGAFIIQNKTQAGVSSAPLICLDSFNAFSNYRITRGYLHNLGEDYFSIENPYDLVNNQWDGGSGEINFGLSNETYIYDNVVAKGVITPDAFAESRFKPYIYTWPNYKSSGSGVDYHEDDKYHTDYSSYGKTSKFHEHCLLYTISDENGNALAVNIYLKDKNEFNEDKTYSERMTAGQFEAADTGNYILTISSAREYSPLYSEWKPVAASMNVNTENAVIVKDGHQISLADIQAGDSVYVLSNNSDAMFVIVE